MNPERSILKLGHLSHEAVISAWLPMTVGEKEKVEILPWLRRS